MPSKAEWEYTATGNTHKFYPWGDEPEANWEYVRMNSGGQGCGEGGTVPVDLLHLGMSAIGCLNMSRNVYEIVEDCWRRNYNYAPTGGSPWLENCYQIDKVIKGGCFGNFEENLHIVFCNNLPSDYRSFAMGGRCNWETHPINCITWYKARHYCMWSGKRLCSESEWTKAARGADERIYPWGNEEPNCYRVAMNDGMRGCEEGHTWSVGSKIPGIYGLHDMSGNIWEFVEDDWYINCEGAPSDGSAWVDSPRSVLLGECFWEEDFTIFPSICVPQVVGNTLELEVIIALVCDVAKTDCNKMV